MKAFFPLFCLSMQACLANHTTFSLDRMEEFYAEFMCEEKDVLFEVGLSSDCFGGSGGVKPLPPAPAPVPVTPPTPPNPNGSYLPVAFKNNSGYSDDEVYILIQGSYPQGVAANTFLSINTSSGEGTRQTVSVGDNGSTYTVKYSDLPAAGSNGKTIYIPQYLDSFLIFISFEKKLNIPVINDNGVAKIQDPAFDNPNDPDGNYNTIWDQIEGAYVSSPPNVNVDATAVSFFSIPMSIYLSTPSPLSASTCGLTQNRSSIFNYAKSCFASVPASPENNQWQQLPLYNGSTPLRILSPGKSGAAGGFDINYLNNANAYSYSYLANIWTSSVGFYKSTPLSIKIPGGKVYSGLASGDTITLRSDDLLDYVTLGPVKNSTTYLEATSWRIFSAKNIYSATSNETDAIQVSKALEEAIIAGIVPTASLIDASTLYTLSSFRPYYQVNKNLSGLGQKKGPWYDLYSSALHACGLIYTYAYDEPLWPEVLLTSDTLLPNTYIGITIQPSK
jgi:hypothetical protein